MKNIGFIGLGNVGGKLASSLLRNKFNLAIFDISLESRQKFESMGAQPCVSPAEVTKISDLIITCLPSPVVSAKVLEDNNGVLSEFSPDKIWCEMSTTDEAEVKRLGAKIETLGGSAVDCPVSGGCHRAATGNISIFAGCKREVFERVFPVLSAMGRRILHTGELGSASILKVMTNYLATANLLSLCEALTTSKLNGIDLNTTYEAIRISSGNSFVHETESQVILNGSRNINFTMDLVLKDITLFQALADKVNLKLNLSPVLVKTFIEAEQRYGSREWSPNIIKLYEDQCGVNILGHGFPEEIEDNDSEVPGYEVKF